MKTSIRHPKDFWIGIIFLFFGLAAVFIGRDYPMGSAGRMGPAYFPTILGGMLALVGVGAAARAFVRHGEAVGRFHIKELVLVLAAEILFGVLMRGAGLVPAIIVLVLVSAFASPKFRWREVLALAAGLAAFSVLVFAKLLGLPMAAFGPWLGF
ncbi:tripartite tricarboxylate transporter TctB family protein [Massilia cavernae]|uniref:Tripartite tricarboxylate transporter TctB family protein n=1 Tax=Massilia cavernae TaxID=2320864 RepID=A0A418X7D5_9BURK|nr:tripartite tricarboxylate transporter TctB family protein [Massilia cavernae]RJG08392.1 tripartite tricarboxylate transporter TctB family protein [Massilia cavernae]